MKKEWCIFMKRNFIKVLSVGLILGALVATECSEVMAMPATPKARAMKEIETNGVPDRLDYRWCKFDTLCEDNCLENGYAYMIKDDLGEVYCLDMEYIEDDPSKDDFLVITQKGRPKEVVSVYRFTDNKTYSVAPGSYHKFF